MRIIWRLHLFLAGTIALCGPAAAAQPWALPSDMVFQRDTSPQAGNLTVMAQDNDGFLWLGSQAGLLRWDGYHFHTYESDPEVPGALPDTHVRALYIDPHQRLWVGTASGGLARLDPQTDEFVGVSLGSGKTAGNNISAIVSDGGDGLLVGTEMGVDHVDGATGKVESLRDGIPKGGAYALLRDHQGALWIGTRSGLLRRAAPDAPTEQVPLPNREGIEPNVTTLYEDASGGIWIGTNLHGVFVIAPGAKQARAVSESGKANALASDRVTSITQTREGEIWIGTYAGMVRIDPAAGTSRRERHDDGQACSLPDDEVHAMFRDRTGLMWVATSTGLSRYDSNQHAIDTILGGSDRPRLVSHPNVPSVLALASGRVWVAVGEGGVDILDPVRGRVGQLRPDPDHPDQALPRGRVMAMVEAPDGSIYLGSQGGLYQASADGSRVRRVAIPQRGLTNVIWVLTFDHQRLWIGGDDGLWEVSLPKEAAPVLHRHLESELGSSLVTSLVRGKDSTMWVGTSNGLVRLDLGNGVATRMPVDATDKSKLPGGHISSLLLDRDGRLWVAAFGRGVQVEQGRDPSGHVLFRRLTARDGLPQNSVDTLLADASGTIWASTDDGLARIDPQSLRVRPYRLAQGVGILGYWTASGTVTPAGELLFGGLGGLTVVHPSRALPPVQVPPLVITEAHLGERAIPMRQIPTLQALDIGANDRSLMLEFAALDYADPEHLRYSYRLLGFDTAWIDSPISRRLVSYTNLPAGEFTLQLRATTPEGDWTAPLDVPVKVRPAWYQLDAVRVGGTLLILALLGGLVHLRTVYLRRRQTELQRLVAERTEELERRTRELRRSQEQLEQMAYFDSLTSLPNRRMFNDELRRLVAQSARGQGDFALLLVDLDGFKQINDQRGHDVGDHLLISVAERLGALMREGDRVARLGGDEFAVLLAQPCNPEAIESACTRLLENLAQPLSFGGASIQVSASIGVAVCPQQGTSPGALYKAADRALYEAKHAGRNTWRRLDVEALAA
jgi:diguanylate cyclase (GGDEF)-like protein